MSDRRRLNERPLIDAAEGKILSLPDETAPGLSRVKAGAVTAK
jgi:hypothetical protein